MDSSRAGFVYFLKSEENDLVKIGKTNNLKTRKKGIQTMSPVHLYTLGAISCPDRHKVEREMHDLFAPYRAHGEWFDFSGRVGILKRCVKFKRRNRNKRNTIFDTRSFNDFWSKEVINDSIDLLEEKARRKKYSENNWRFV